jgi:hypothetical protein
VLVYGQEAPAQSCTVQAVLDTIRCIFHRFKASIKECIDTECCGRYLLGLASSCSSAIHRHGSMEMINDGSEAIF